RQVDVRADSPRGDRRVRKHRWSRFAGCAQPLVKRLEARRRLLAAAGRLIHFGKSQLRMKQTRLKKTANRSEAVRVSERHEHLDELSDEPARLATVAD